MLNIATAVVFGLIAGSFANVCLWRLPRGESILAPRSRCPSCHTPITWYQNVPVLSFILLRRRCAACKAKISWRYPAVELLFALLFGVVASLLPDRPLAAFFTCVLVFYSVVMALIDARHRIIPDVLSLSLLILGLAVSPWNDRLAGTPKLNVLWALGGSLFGFMFLLGIAWLGRVVWKRDAMGGGDIKLMAAVGALLGWDGVLMTLFWGSLAGTLWAFLLWLGRRLHRGHLIPFGPFLILAAWISWFYQGFFRSWLAF